MNSYYYQTLRAFKRKLELISLCGGGCKLCGYKKNIAALEFHHKVPTKKKMQLDIRRLSNHSMKSILEELEKCILLCANCHRELHSPHLDFDTVVKFVEDVSEAVIQTRNHVGKPNCSDCGTEINYTHIRCRPCANKKKRRFERPDIQLLSDEYNEHGVSWCGRKYGVARRTIKKWLGLNK